MLSYVTYDLSDISGSHGGDRLMMLAVSTSETSVNFYQITRRDNPEDGHLHLWFSLKCFDLFYVI
jgi:hypothetical protein